MPKPVNFAPALTQWFSLHGRDLPWRNDRDPYKVWISEIMLQQTRVAQTVSYFRRFMRRFPDVFALAEAKQEEVLKYWEGLGYYSRARNLHTTAQEIVRHHTGKFPGTFRDLLELKGIGPYTSRAISSIAFGEPVAVVDGNVLRLVSRYTGDSSPVNLPATREKFQELLDVWIRKSEPSVFNEAMMDLGAMVCLPKNPACPECPLASHCEANRRGTPELFPVKEKKAAKKIRYYHYFIVRDTGNRILIRQRPQAGLWAGLYEIPNEEVSVRTWKKNPENTQYKGEFRHILTHIEMRIRIFEKAADRGVRAAGKFISPGKIPNFAFSRAVHKVFEIVLKEYPGMISEHE